MGRDLDQPVEVVHRSVFERDVDVLFPAGDQLRSGQIVRVQAPASRSRTRIDLWDQPVKPTLLQHRRVDRDPVDVKAEGLLEAGVLCKGTVKVV